MLDLPPRLVLVSATLVWVAATACEHSKPAAAPLPVAAAANLMDVCAALARAFEEESGGHVTYSFGSTVQLAQQIEHGAPFDLFAAADTAHVAKLDAERLLTPGSRAVYARGRLALWIPEGSTAQIASLDQLADKSVRYVAIAKPEAAPYGQAAVETLQALGLWDRVRSKVVYAQNISMAKQYAASNNADAAFTAYSLVIHERGRVLEVDERFHRPIEQSLGIMASSPRQKLAQQFRGFLLGARGQAILREYGYR